MHIRPLKRYRDIVITIPGTLFLSKLLELDASDSKIDETVKKTLKKIEGAIYRLEPAYLDQAGNGHANRPR